MLPSWSDALRRPFAPRTCLGIALAPHALAAAYGTLREGQWQVDWLREAPLAAPVFSVRPNEAAVQALSAALAKVAAAARGAWLPVQIALPDPLFHVAVVELDDVPKDAAAREQLIAWRLKKGLHLADVPWAYRSQDLGEAGGKRLLLGVALEKVWLEAIQSACRQAEITPTWIDRAGGFYAHRVSAAIAKDRDSALVVVDASAWSLTLCDAAGRTRYVRARWRRDGDTTEIAGDIEHAIRAYLRAGAERAIEHVSVCGDSVAGEAMMDALRARLRGACVWTELPRPKEAEGTAATAAIAAAAYRS